MLTPLTFPDQSIALAEELQANSKPSWSIYQSPNRKMTKSQAVNPSSRTAPPDLPDTVQCESNRELGSHHHNPVPGDPPDQLNPYEKFSSSRLLFRELSPEKRNSSRFNIKPDPVNWTHSQFSDRDEADLLLPERSFNISKTVALLLENPQNPQRKSFLVLQSPGPVLTPGQDVPMSTEPAQGFSWLQVESPVQTAEPDLDLMVASPPHTCRTSWTVHSDQHSSSVLEQSGILLSKRSFGRRKSERAQSVSRASDPVWDVPMSPAAEPVLNQICLETPVMDVQMTPQPNNTTCTTGNDVEISQKLNCDVPMSPIQPPAPPTAPGTPQYHKPPLLLPPLCLCPTLSVMFSLVT